MIILTLVGCSTTEEDILTLGCSNFSDSLDPSASPNSAWGTARYGVGEGLFRFDDSMNAQPHLCDYYEVNEEKTIWKFHIRDGVKFSNGKDLSASEVVKSLEYLYEQERTFKGTNKPSQYLEYSSIIADDLTNVVTITTKQPYADLTKVLAHVNYIILDVASNLNVAPTGTGPYRITRNEIGVSLSLEKNKNYWGGEVPFEKLEVLYMEDSTIKAMALQSGDVDIVDSITTAHDLKLLRDSPDFNVAETVSTRTAFSYINYEGILKNDVLREAILLAIDDQSIAEITLGGVYTAGYAVLPLTLDYGYSELKDKTPFNLELAKQKLDEAGIIDKNGDGIRELNGQNITIDYISYVMKSLDIVAEAVSANLNDLGLVVNLSVLDSDTHWNMVVNKEFDLAINSWLTVPVGDPIGFLKNWYSKSDINYSSYKNDEYDILYESLLSEIKLDYQKALIKRMQQILIDDCAVLINGYYESNLSSTSKIEGVKMPMSESFWITTDIKPVLKAE
ncbi:MAG: peptide-binding protein [Candidatus Epulonipiscioides saccharophilum]|nr:MAG: peptide-binding protein [Epulopiscium sp. AS2M-Bin001]